MNLRQKVLLTLTAAFIVIIVFLFVLSSSYFLSSYERLEATHVSQQVMVINSQLDSQESGLYTLAKDWGTWDETYQYINGKNPDFVERNLAPDIIAGMRLNFLVITDAQGNPVYSTGFDLENDRVTCAPADLIREVSDPKSRLRDMSVDHTVRGILTLPGGPAIIAAHPILHSDTSGPPAGMVIIGRYADDRMLGNYGSATHYTISAAPVRSDQAPQQGITEIVAGPAKIGPSANALTVFIRPLDDATVEGSAVIQDIRGNNSIQLAVMMPRDIYQQGKTTLFSFLIILASIALIIGIMVISLIDTLVLQRLSFLYTEVDAIGKTGDISSRVWIDGDDEIAHLATGMNASLEKLEITQMNLRKSESELNTIINTSPIPQFVIDKTHTILHWNKALENLTGIKADTIIGTKRQWTAFYDTLRPCVADLVVDGKTETIPEVYAGKYTRSELLGGQYEVTDFFPGLGESGKWLYFTSTGIHDSGGAVTGAIQTLVDITEQKNTNEEMSRTNEQLTAALQEIRSTEEVLIGNIRELEKAKQKLQKSEAKFRDIATNIPGIVFQFTIHGPSDITIPFISDRISMFTLGPDEIYSNPNALFNLVHRDDADFVRTSLLESARTKVPWNVEFRMKANGVESPRWFNGRGIPHELEEDTIWVGVLIDITERKLLQEEIGTALKEKELLLKEIHHRVKNNIQVIASLLNMQSRTVEDQATKEVLREAQNRVKSIALVHEKLYQSKSLDRIDYHDYIQKISHHLFESYGVSQKNITMNIRAENISLHIDKAIPCSLIINELLSNAFKHAFPPGTKGDIWIELRKNGNTMELTYRDNGIGLPEGISLEHADTLGMRLLYGLTSQLHGTIDVKGFEGTHITITFPNDPAKDVTP